MPDRLPESEGSSHGESTMSHEPEVANVDLAASYRPEGVVMLT